VLPLDDLLHEPFVLRERGSGTRQVAETYLREAGVDLDQLRVVAELSGIDAIKAAVAAGLGISIISRSALPMGALHGA
jgi:DNA-binding transcriptional LysR family regulator